MSKWKLDRSIPAIVVITGILYSAYTYADIQHIKTSILQYNTIPERLARLEQKTDDILLILKSRP